ADGTALDNTFGPASDGKITINFGADDKASGVALRPDGRIVVVGSWTGLNSDFAIAQLTPDGKLDTTFGGGQQGANSGKFNFSFGTGNPPFEQQEFATGVALQPDGKIVMVGYSDINVNNGPNDFAIARVLPDGTALDTTFETDGKVTIDFGGEDRANAVAIDPNGRIVVGGFAGASPNGDFAIVRLIGRTEDGLRLAVGGSLNGQAAVFTPNYTTGQYPAAPTATTPASVFPGFTGNVRVAVGDVNGDHVPDIAMVTGPGTPIRFAVLSGVDNATPLIPPTAPFSGSEGFTGGGFISVGDLDNDGRAEVILTADQGGGSRVTIFSLLPDGTVVVRANFLGITGDPNFRGGARSSVGDVNGDGVQDVMIAAGFLGGPRVALFDGKTVFTTQLKLVNDFFIFPGDDATRLRNGAFVALGDVNGDGFADVVGGGGPGGAPRIFILSGALVSAGSIDAAYAAPIANFFVAGNINDRGGVRVITTDADGDHKADVAAGSGEGSAANVRVYLGKNFTSTAEPGTFQDLGVFGGAPLTGGVFVG
ncbi:MAG TPA: FG-GAP-like repeat-containing protein, partial [Gemmataceae bacterium]|nr:FG-GAP-like repeat-containing protein [Gemmataceae bacterium]